MEFQTTNHRTNELNLQGIGDTMDVLYLSQKLRHTCLVLSHRAVYQTKLETLYLESTVFFNMARLEYERKNYHKILEYLQTTEIKDLVNQLIARNLMLKIYYELAGFDVLESHLDSFRLFIRRREVSDYHRTNFKKHHSFHPKIDRLSPLRTSRTAALVRGCTEQEEVLTEKKWLLEKLGEM